jgi:hypothetical protein
MGHHRDDFCVGHAGGRRAERADPVTLSSETAAAVLMLASVTVIWWYARSKRN